jgi:thioredoxin 2
VASIVRTCTACGRGNRVKAADVAKTIRCGACKATLGPVDHPIDAAPDLFNEVINNVKVPVLVDFWAAWCGPCRMAAPEVARVAKEMAGRAVVLKVDTDQHQALASHYGVRGIPNFIVFINGRVALQQAGVVGAEQMKAWLDQSRTQPI